MTAFPGRTTRTAKPSWWSRPGRVREVGFGRDEEDIGYVDVEDTEVAAVSEVEVAVRAAADIGVWGVAMTRAATRFM